MIYVLYTLANAYRIRLFAHSGTVYLFLGTDGNAARQWLPVQLLQRKVGRG